MKDITICMPIAFNTNEDDFPNRVANTLKSYRECDPTRRLQLSVSTMFDVSQCLDILNEHWVWYNRMLTVSIMEGEKYDHGVAKNTAAGAATTERLFITDCDILVPKSFLKRYDEVVKEKMMWYPISMEITHPEDPGRWRHTAWNSLGIFKSVFEEYLKGWSDEHASYYYFDDQETHYRALKLKRKGIGMVEENLKDFIHPSHSRTTKYHKIIEFVKKGKDKDEN